jgi:hypothetical protein
MRRWPTSHFCRLASIQKPTGKPGALPCNLPSGIKLTRYYAAYLELAQRRGVPLATLDGELRDAARVEGITLLG